MKPTHEAPLGDDKDRHGGRLMAEVARVMSRRMPRHPPSGVRANFSQRKNLPGA